METLTLTTAEVIPQITTTDYRVVYLALEWEPGQADQARITIQLKGTNGERKDVLYTGAIAVTLITALNKADLSVKSLQRRILERIVADAKLSGVVNGTPA